MRRRFCFVLSFLMIGLFAQACKKPVPVATLILRNGFIYTVDPENRVVESIAIKGDRILAIGTDQEMARFVGPKTAVLDLEGRFACPGFNDAHIHLPRGVMDGHELDLSGVHSIRDIQRAVMRRYEEIRKDNPGGWTVGRGWDQTLYPGNERPTRSDIDRFVSEAPVFLRRVCGHVAVANGKALDIAGIDRHTPDPPGGRIVRDPRTGEPNGILEEKAMDLVIQYLPPPSKAAATAEILNLLDRFRRLGITSIQGPCDSLACEILASLLETDRLTCHVSMWMPLEADLSTAKRTRSKYRGTMIRAGLLKGYIDGSLGSRTAALFRSYADAPETFGLQRMTQNALNLLVLKADREGFQVGLHAIGDRANRMALDAFELARELNGRRDSRHRIEHAQVLDPEDIPRFARLGVTASMQPSHCLTDLLWAEHRLGTRRSRTAYAWNELAESGTVLAFGTDWPAAPLDPLIGIYTAVTRRDTSGYPAQGWFPEQRIGIGEAIRAYTLGSAYAEFTDPMKGSLEPGKLADIVVFDRNLLRIPPQELLRAGVAYTILGGKIIYRAVPEDDVTD